MDKAWCKRAYRGGLKTGRAYYAGRTDHTQYFGILQCFGAFDKFVDANVACIRFLELAETVQFVELQQRQPVDHTLRHTGSNRSGQTRIGQRRAYARFGGGTGCECRGDGSNQYIFRFHKLPRLSFQPLDHVFITDRTIACHDEAEQSEKQQAECDRHI